MKTKFQLFIAAFLLTSFSINAQNKAIKDTTVLFNQKKIEISDSLDEVRVKVSKNNQSDFTPVYEAVFTDNQTVETYNVDAKFDIQTPFGSLIDRKGRLPMRTHWSGFGVGYAGLANSKEIGFKPYMSWELNTNFMDISYFMIANRLALFTGFGMSLKNYQLAKDKVFIETKNDVIVHQLSAEDTYKHNNTLFVAELNIPFLVEWQPKLNTKHPVHFQLGFISSIIRYGAFNTLRVDPMDNSKYFARTKGMYINTGLDFYLQIGYGNFGVYGKYSPLSVFDTINTSKINQYSIGVNWYF